MLKGEHLIDMRTLWTIKTYERNMRTHQTDPKRWQQSKRK